MLSNSEGIFLTFSLTFFQKSLRDVQQILNSTEGNFHQLVALLNCRGLNKVTQSSRGNTYNKNN